MRGTVQLCHDYSFSARDVWNMATNRDHLKTATEGLLASRDLPNGQICEGRTPDVLVSLLGWLSYQPFRICVVQFDDADMHCASDERGIGVKVGRHTFHAIATVVRAKIHENIETETGCLTPLFVAWARFSRRSQHLRKAQILGQLQSVGGPG